MTHSKLARLLNSVFFVALVLMSLSCQTSIEPDDVVPEGGFRATVRVVDQGNNPIDNARVQWIISRAGSSQQQLDSAFNASAGAQSALTGSNGNPGVVSFQIPVPVAQAGVLVLFKTTPPVGSDFLGVQKNGNIRVDTLKVCGETFLTITLQRVVNVQCNGSTNCKDLSLTIEPPVRTRDTVAQGDLIQTDGPITITSVSGIPGNFSNIGILTSVFNVNSGVSQGIPATIPQNTPYRIRFDVDASSSTASVDTVFTVTVTASQNGVPCWSCTFDVRLIVKRQSNCDCPTKGMQFTMGPDTSCVNVLKMDTLKNIALANTSADCQLQLVLDHSKLTEPISEVWVSQMNAQLGEQILLPSGSSLNSVIVNFQPQSSRNYNQNFVFTMFRVSKTGQITRCDSTLQIRFRGTGGNPLFAIDSAGSSIFVRNGSSYRSDTLKQCTIHPDPNTGQGRLCLMNPGNCPLVVDLSIINGSSVFSIDTTVLTIPAGKSQCITVTFQPSNSDVYPAGRCTPPIRNFNGAIRASSSFGSATIPLLGFADLDVNCAGKAVLIAPKFGARDVAGINYFITLDILQDNTITNGEQSNGLTDSVKIFVKDIITSGPPPNDANITSAVLSTGQFQRVKFYWKANLKSLPSDICQLFNTYGCPTPNNALTDQPVVEGDILIFEYKGSYGILWIKKLAWSDHTNNALPQVEGLVCYPFN